MTGILRTMLCAVALCLAVPVEARAREENRCAGQSRDNATWLSVAHPASLTHPSSNKGTKALAAPPGLDPIP